ncbi:unnamed protein product [Aureobasidium mustum]|uniref:C2H2-type domain-containing protein n=1 Tax=Aureobasidium mustum TaxID=2773714 RepID=A0A9N8PM87_9PEZI|nr:unnamed protein product [Aureobasidium mustum]
MDSTASYDMVHRRIANLSIDTNTFHGQSALISPPESANSARRSSYDMSYHQTPLSTYHPNTPVHFSTQDMYNVLPSDKLKMSFHQFPPSPVDFSSQGQQNYATACNSPTWSSSMVFAQKPDVDNSFYQDSSTLLSTEPDWDSSLMSQHPSADYAPDPSTLFTLPSHDSSMSFMTDIDSSHPENLPNFIAPSQAVHHQPPELVDYNMSLSGWGGLQTPVHDSSILHSSSPAEYSPVTPPTVDCSFDASYIKHELSPSSSIYGHTSRSSLGKKGRKMSKADKRRSICKNVPVSNTNTSITLLTDEQSDMFRVLKDEEKKTFSAGRKMYTCKIAHCRQSFARSEHCKRHETSHADDYPYECYICHHRFDPNDPKSQCKVGKKNNGKQNRNDNSRSHHWTHVKAYLVSNDPLVRERLKQLNKKSKGRNYALAPTQMYELVRNRDTPEQQEVVLKFLNGEAGKEFGVHILWEEKGCPVIPCQETLGIEGCGMCRAKQGKGKKE